MNAQQEIRFRFSPQSSKSKKVLGPLEGDIMEVVWGLGPTTVSAVHKVLREKKDIAYTTVMTTMSRLAKKNLLLQDTSASSYVYTPSLARNDFERYVVKGVLNGLLDDFGEHVLTYFVETLDERDPELKDSLKTSICG